MRWDRGLDERDRSKDFRKSDPRGKTLMPGQIAASELAGDNSIASFGWGVGSELLLVFGDVDLHLKVSGIGAGG